MALKVKGSKFAEKIGKFVNFSFWVAVRTTVIQFSKKLGLFNHWHTPEVCIEKKTKKTFDRIFQGNLLKWATVRKSELKKKKLLKKFLREQGQRGLL